MLALLTTPQAVGTYCQFLLDKDLALAIGLVLCDSGAVCDMAMAKKSGQKYTKIGRFYYIWRHDHTGDNMEKVKTAKKLESLRPI